MQDTLQEKLNKIKSEGIEKLKSAKNDGEINLIKSLYLGKKSEINGILGGISTLSLEEKRMIGAEVNRVKGDLQKAIEEAYAAVVANESVLKNFDPGLPGFLPRMGRLHPLTLVRNEIKAVFTGMGFTVAEGPEVETDYYNFEALNTPRHHPARDMQDTFYAAEDIVLRTHTSPVQIRVMEKEKPPIRVIMPGRVYRHEEISARSYCLFHQVEGLYVDEGVTFGNLKGTLDAFVKAMFGPGVRTRFRPSFFPFTEPSAEMDVQCFLCGGRGCPVCKRTGWLEIMGCGMVDPNVFKAVNIDDESYTGYAFGMGIDRIAMLKYGIDDIRLFFENDIRFLEQFN
ncbi:MAG: phenylalanine--tRNA ligase subunit alpha [Syntrophaceae bacterium]